MLVGRLGESWSSIIIATILLQDYKISVSNCNSGDKLCAGLNVSTTLRTVSMGMYSNDIVNCQVSDRGLKHFMRLNQLKELRLGSAEDNKFTINGFREVLKALKNHRGLAILEMKLPDEKVVGQVRNMRHRISRARR